MSENATRTLLIVVSRRLLLALSFIFVLTLGVTAAAAIGGSEALVPAVVVLTGVLGGFVGVQRRLKDLTVQDLETIAQSWVYTLLSPLVGGVLALALYVLFLSGLLTGDLFPAFRPDRDVDGVRGFAAIFKQHGESYQVYAKLLFWCFVAGFSERFVTDVIGRFEGAAVKTLAGD